MTVAPRSPRLAAPEHEEDVAFTQDADFGQYIVLLWRRLPLVAIAAVACAAIGFVLAASRSVEYEATSTLAVSGSKIGEQSPSVASANYRPFIENNSVAATVVKEFQLDKPPFELTPARLLDNALSLEEVRNSNLIRVHITLTDPVTAAKVANRVSDLAVEGALKLSQAEAIQARDYLRVEVDDSRKHREDASAKLESFKTSAQVELTRADVNSMLEQRGKLLPLVVDIEEARGRVARGEAELAAGTRIDSLVKSIDSDPTALQAARTAGASDTALLGMQIKSQETNKVYESIEEQLAFARTELAALERRRAELIGVRKLDARQQSKLTDLYRKESELARLTADYEVADKSYKEIAARYDVARVQVAGRSGQIQVIDRAIELNTPKARHRGRNAVFGFVGGGTLAALGVVLIAAMRDTLKRAKAA
jgi:uncharacterized protein involved in exopolysaccharide biosynthesis